MWSEGTIVLCLQDLVEIGLPVDAAGLILAGLRNPQPEPAAGAVAAAAVAAAEWLEHTVSATCNTTQRGGVAST